MSLLVALANLAIIVAAVYLAMEIVIRSSLRGRKASAIGILVLWAYLTTLMLHDPGQSGLWAGPIQLAILILGTIFAIRSPRLPLYRMAWQRLARERESVDLAQARRAAGRDGHVIHAGRMRIWTDGDPALASRIQRVLEAALAASRDLLGPELPELAPLRVICFAERDAMRRYHGALGPTMEMTAGYYTGIRRMRIVVSADHPMGFERLIAHELAHHVGYSLIGRRHLEPPWASEGMASHIEIQAMARLGPPPPAREAEVRRRILRASLRRGELPGLRELIGTRRLALARWTARDEDPVGFRKGAVFYILSTMLIETLHREQPAALRAFFGAKPWRGNLAAFRRHFDAPEPIYQAIVGPLEAPVASPPPPPAAERERYANLVKRAVDAAQPPAARRQAMRLLASTGLAAGLEPIAALVDDPVWGAEARMLFEHLTGERWEDLDPSRLPGIDRSESD